MHHFMDRLRRFMAGRYGVDSLYYGLNTAWLVLILLSLLTRSGLFSLLSWVCFGYMIFRFLSRNTARRRAENEAYLRVWNPVKAFFKLQVLRVRERKTHVYRRCPQCHAALRLPRRPGDHTVACPRCGKRFDVRLK